VDEDHTTVIQGLLDKLASEWEVDQKISVVDVVDLDAQLSNTACGFIGGYRILAHGDDMSDAPLAKSSRRSSCCSAAIPEGKVKVES
jgi:hypothetical protein